MKIPTLLKNRKRLVLISIPLLLVLGLLVRQRSKTVEVTATKAERRELTRFVSASGETSVEDRLVKHSQVTTTIKKINFKNMDSVKEGDEIVELDRVSFKSSLDTALASFLTAKANLDTNYSDILFGESNVKAKKQIRDRDQELYNADRSFDNKEDLKTSEANYQSALADLAEVKNKRASLEQTTASSYSSYLSAKQNYESTRVEAPADGILILGDIHEGEQVTPGTKLFSVYDQKTPTFTAEVDEADILEVEVGNEASVILDSYYTSTASQGGGSFSGTVKEVSAKTKVAESGATVIDVVISLSDAPRSIIGLSGEAKIKVAEKTGDTTLPSDFVDEDSEGSFVWINERGKATKKRVITGLLTDEYYEINSGIGQNDTVIKGEGLYEGVKVSIKGR